MKRSTTGDMLGQPRPIEVGDGDDSDARNIADTLHLNRSLNVEVNSSTDAVVAKVVAGVLKKVTDGSKGKWMPNLPAQSLDEILLESGREDLRPVIEPLMKRIKREDPVNLDMHINFGDEYADSRIREELLEELKGILGEGRVY